MLLPNRMNELSSIDPSPSGRPCSFLTNFANSAVFHACTRARRSSFCGLFA